MKIAAFNVENLFDRAKVFNHDDNKLAKEINDAVAGLNNLFAKETYTQIDKDKMLELLKELGLSKVDDARYAIFRQIRGKLISRPKNKPAEVVAKGREYWTGWVELKTEHVNAIAIQNTARVIRDVNADILAVVEAENRVSLKQFNDILLKQMGGVPYSQIMLIDGNDTRGIDVGLMTKAGYAIGNMRSNIHVMKGAWPVFSRDSPEYSVTTPDGEHLWVIPSHFKSKYGGNNASSKRKRKGQAEELARIYNRLKKDGAKNIVVLGDLNDTPDSDELSPLLTETDLKDVGQHPAFDTGKFNGKGTHGLGNDKDKIDYLLLSPALYERIKKCGLFRMGAWPGARAKWEVYPELKREEHAASDHHVIWADV